MVHQVPCIIITASRRRGFVHDIIVVFCYAFLHFVLTQGMHYTLVDDNDAMAQRCRSRFQRATMSAVAVRSSRIQGTGVSVLYISTSQVVGRLCIMLVPLAPNATGLDP